MGPASPHIEKLLAAIAEAKRQRGRETYRRNQPSAPFTIEGEYSAVGSGQFEGYSTADFSETYADPRKKIAKKAAAARWKKSTE